MTPCPAPARRPIALDKVAALGLPGTKCRRDFLALTAPALLALAGCGGGGDTAVATAPPPAPVPPAPVPPPPSPPPPPPPPPTAQGQTQAAIDAIGSAWAALPHASRVDDLQRMFVFVRALPLVKQAVLSPTGSIAARFGNGDGYVFIDNLDVDGLALRSASQTNNLRALAVPADQLPSGSQGGRAVLFNGFVGLPNPLLPLVAGAHLDAMAAALVSKGYATRVARATLDALESVVDTDVFYLNGHGGDGLDEDGNSTIVVLAAEYLDNPLAWVTARTLGPGKVGFAHFVNRQPPNLGITGVFYVTPKFFAAKSRFTQNSLAVLNCCCSGPSYTPVKVPAPRLKLSDAMFQAGASVFVGWSNEINEGESIESCETLFDRLLGTNAMATTTPPTRAFPWPAVLGHMSGGQLKHSVGKTQLLMSQSKINDATDADGLPPSTAFMEIVQDPKTKDPASFGMLAPSISSLQIGFSGGAVSLLIAGNFGDDLGGTGTVTVGGRPLAVRQWRSNGLTCAVPSGGGDVVVTSRGHASAPRRLTEWRGSLSYSAGDAQSLSQELTVNLVVLSDVSQTRSAPGEALTGAAPYLRISSFVVVPQASANYPCSGEWKSDDGKTTVTFSGGGGLQPLRFGGVGTFSYEGRLDPLAGVVNLMFNANSSAKLTIERKEADGTTSTVSGTIGMSSQISFRSSSDGQGRLTLGLDSKSLRIQGASFFGTSGLVDVRADPLQAAVSVSSLAVVPGTEPVLQAL